MKIRDENGGSAVEFALVAPVLLLILFGIIEFGILLYDKAMITNASREGARAGIVFVFDPDGPTRISDAEIRTIVENYCSNYLLSFGGTGLQPPAIARWGPGGGTAAGDSLRVTVNYQFRFLVLSNLMAFIGGALADPLNLRAVTVMRLE